MSKRFPIDFSDVEHKALKRAAVEADMTMNAFIKVAVAEKIATASAVLAQANHEKPA